MKKVSKGFTLVELAIVITIIGLLIGGVLKGQELLQNARMTSSASKLKSIVTATITFKDIYKALLGDIANPGNFLQNCTTAPCNVSGDANGMIGLDGSVFEEENARYWMHLAKAGLISGVDPNKAWSSPSVMDASYPAFDLGGGIAISSLTVTPNPSYPNGLTGHHFFPMLFPSGDASLPHNVLAKYDLKIDDGRPYTGDVVIFTTCVVPTGAVAYSPSFSIPCYMLQSTGF